MADPTPFALEATEARHVSVDSRHQGAACLGCPAPWPCDAALACQEVRRLTNELDNVRCGCEFPDEDAAEAAPRAECAYHAEKRLALAAAEARVEALRVERDFYQANEKAVRGMLQQELEAMHTLQVRLTAVEQERDELRRFLEEAGR